MEDNYIFQEYPKWMHAEGKESFLAENAEAESLYLGKPIVVESTVGIEDLTAAAIELGIKVDARWGVKRLQEEILKAQ
jgi:hypothetical protein